jgi:glycosyltransferase involved in cell wall biosynthesis
MNVTALPQPPGRKSLPYVSIVIPVFDEADSLRLLYDSLRSAMDPTGYSWEVVFVDDGSTDGTARVLRELHEKEPGVRVVELRRNFGQTAAMAAGFDHSRGEIIIAMDGDLQNDPMDIPRLIEKLNEGYDVVSGWRANRQDGFWLRRFPSRLANWLISRTTGTYLHDYGCTLKAYRREIMQDLRLYGEMHRFIPALLGGNGARICELPVTHHARRYGRSKYGIARTVRVFLDLLLVKFSLSFHTKPLQIFGLIGLLAFLPGAAICLYLIFGRIFLAQQLADRPLFLLAIFLMLVGTQFVSMGILAEIQIRTYHEASNKPIYLIRQVLDFRLPQPSGSPSTSASKTPKVLGA